MHTLCSWAQRKWPEVQEPELVEFTSFGETILATIRCKHGLHMMHMHQPIDVVIKDIIGSVL